MSSRYDCTDPAAREAGLRHARDALARGELVVFPTDTVHGIAADAFDPEAVARLLAAKGRGRAMPPPVLVSDVAVLDGLAAGVPATARALAEAFWPGGLTLVCRAQPSLRWDLGDTGGTVAVRVPNHDLVRELLRSTGPLAVSSANKTGRPAATSAAEAEEQLGDVVAAYLDDGSPARTDAPPSTIVDATGEQLRVLRRGAVSTAALRAVAPVEDDDEPTG
ncbi:translation factor SUA5 [Quadrisphaera granulorum]|uniref:L-threonylcarbamoyladenylate synthase n=1 Tax=Quadrisphaera granulorum TaxID=317664 RepID=A0A316AES6_9ACTN|nr:L-threonylcarbamoyladenylate synthase [Quadrisphaera granulorum]PWJ56285.1 translation factor SUA5 [Quadrisphaera granulorum]SZE94919.1 translation factor SUA5 [Quadrisphaera granulorum]